MVFRVPQKMSTKLLEVLDLWNYIHIEIGATIYLLIQNSVSIIDSQINFVL